MEHLSRGRVKHWVEPQGWLCPSCPVPITGYKTLNLFFQGSDLIRSPVILEPPLGLSVEMEGCQDSRRGPDILCS